MVTVLNPYLNFPGTAEEAFKFYKSVFGGDFAMVQRYKDVPNEQNKLSAGEGEKILHISLPVGKGNILMASDVVPSMGWPLNVGNNFSLSISAESKAEADKLFAGLSAGGQVKMPMADQFWGDYFGMCVDKFQIQWMVSHNPNRP